MAYLYQDFQSGTLSADCLANAAAFSSSALATVIDVSGGDQLLVTLNPFGQDGVPPENVAITAHALGSTSAAITNTLYDHKAGTQWFVGPVAAHWTGFQDQLDTQFNTGLFSAAGSILAATAPNTVAELLAASQTGHALVAALTASQKMAWQPIPKVVTSSTRPQGSATYVGMPIFESDSLHMLVCVAVGTPSTWQYVDTPPGAVCEFFGSTVPTGWFWLNGQAISRTGVGAALFAQYGTAYGVGNGTTTFNLPDMRERTFVGTDMGLSSPGLVVGATLTNPGATGGTSQTALTSSHIPQHNHSGTTSSDGGHNHGGSMANDGDHVHGIGPDGDVLIQYKKDASTEGHVSSGITGNHIIGSHMQSDGVHNHALTINFVSNHNHTISNYGSASPTPVSAMQPYMSAGYIVRG